VEYLASAVEDIRLIREEYMARKGEVDFLRGLALGKLGGLQSATETIDLDIHIDIARRELRTPVREYQCVNIGFGPHASEMVEFLAEHGVRYDLSGE